MILFNIFVVLLFWGPLLPWSPVTLGYNVYSADHFRVLYPSDTKLPEFYTQLDDRMTELGTRLGMPLKRDITIIRSNQAGLRWYVPWLDTQMLGGTTLLTGNAIYINHQVINEMEGSEEDYVAHELVHLLSHQHSSLINAYKARKFAYLTEGLPVAVAGPTLVSNEEFSTLLAKATLEETNAGSAIYESVSFATMHEDNGERYRFSQALYGKFINYLIEMYGQSRFNAFHQAFLKDPDNHRSLIKKYYGQELEILQQHFENSLR